MDTTETIIVDENDNIICHKQRKDMVPKDIFRVSALCLQNSKGEILLARRAYIKKYGPGQWDPAVAGTNDKGETYQSNMIKEAEEEIGLTNYDFKKSNKIRFKGKFNCFCQWYYAVIDRDVNEFVLRKEEVEEISWVTKEELLKILKTEPEGPLESIIDVLDKE